MPKMILFAGNANPNLAYAIAEKLNLPMGKALVDRFSDGETRVEILENVRGKDVFIIQPTGTPANENVMELMIMADALRRASARRITAVVPYYGYARQDRRVRSARVPITAKAVADMFASVGISRLLTIDLHADQIQGFFYMPVDNLYTTPTMLSDITQKRQSDCNNVLVVSPDVGGVVRARAIAKRLNDTELAIIDKRRTGPNKVEVMHVIGDVSGRDCIIVDDIIDTGGTLCNAAAELKSKGAKTVAAYITHPVLSGNAIQSIENSVLDEVVVTDTLPLSSEAHSCKKIRQISLANLLSEAIQRINAEESLSSMMT